uniref:Enhancer of mRNA-decapping protein 4 C-terminal domain-containing protein n=1 Tax=Plectus sambesii TaxID=2011161 RepID=A0A914WTY1_9BILA
EVRSILEHAPDVVDDDHDGDDEDEEDVEDEEVEDEHRPDTPVAHTLAAEDDEGNWAPNVMDAVDATNPHAIEQLANAVNKMSMELERLASHSDRQHTELERFRASDEHLLQRFLEAQKRTMEEYWQHFRPTHDATHERDQILADAVRRLEPSLKAELSHCVISTLASTKDAIESDLSEKVALSDTLLRDSMTKLAKSKTVAESFGKSVAESVSQQVAVAYNDAVRTVVVPSFDALTRSLFEQLNETFRKGVKEYVDQLERQTRTVRETNDEWKSQVMNHLTNVTDQMRAMLERHINSLTASLQSHMDKQIQGVAKRLQDSVVESVRTLVREETNRAVSENQQSLNESLARIYRSQAGTPVSTVGGDRQSVYKELLQRLQARDFNGAFEQALSMCDLSLLLFVCTKVDPKQLFAREPCPLKQPIVLSLLQQLTADLSTQTELKLKYVEEALMSIDVKNPEVIPHLQSVLTQANDSIQTDHDDNSALAFGIVIGRQLVPLEPCVHPSSSSSPAVSVRHHHSGADWFARVIASA